ncbi:MAG: hypothetical protein AABY22_04280 [Nanoarchaeota archaeon]
MNFKKFISCVGIIGIFAIISFLSTEPTEKIYYVLESKTMADSYKTSLEDEEGRITMVNTDKNLIDDWVIGKGIKWKLGSKEIILDLQFVIYEFSF